VVDGKVVEHDAQYLYRAFRIVENEDAAEQFLRTYRSRVNYESICESARNWHREEDTLTRFLLDTYPTSDGPALEVDLLADFFASFCHPSAGNLMDRLEVKHISPDYDIESLASRIDELSNSVDSQDLVRRLQKEAAIRRISHKGLSNAVNWFMSNDCDYRVALGILAATPPNGRQDVWVQLRAAFVVKLKRFEIPPAYLAYASVNLDERLFFSALLNNLEELGISRAFSGREFDDVIDAVKATDRHAKPLNGLADKLMGAVLFARNDPKKGSQLFLAAIDEYREIADEEMREFAFKFMFIATCQAGQYNWALSLLDHADTDEVKHWAILQFVDPESKDSAQYTKAISRRYHRATRTFPDLRTASGQHPFKQYLARYVKHHAPTGTISSANLAEAVGLLGNSPLLMRVIFELASEGHAESARTVLSTVIAQRGLTQYEYERLVECGKIKHEMNSGVVLPALERLLALDATLLAVEYLPAWKSAVEHLHAELTDEEWVGIIMQCKHNWVRIEILTELAKPWHAPRR